MKKSYRLKELGCANCAAKMERDIRKLEGVNQADISFMTTKMTIDADDSCFEDIIAQAEKIIHKYEPQVSLTRA